VVFVASLFEWSRIPFVVALGVAFAFALLQMTGALGLLAADGDVDADGDGDVDADADADHDADGEHEGAGGAILRQIGVGKAPLFVLGETFAVTFGVIGLALDAVLGVHALVWSVPIAALVALGATRMFAGAIARILGRSAEASARADLVGTAGVVISSRVDAEFGEARLRDRHGQIVRVICRAEGDAIPEGREVVVVDEDERDHRLVVAALDVRAP
jgi:hypothetical protein